MDHILDFHLKIDCLLINQIILMFKSVRLYFIIAFVTRTNFGICRCLTALAYPRAFYIKQLWQRNSITHQILITALHLIWSNGYKGPKKWTSKLLVAQLNSSLLHKTVAVGYPEKIYFKFFRSFMESNFCQQLELN